MNIYHADDSPQESTAVSWSVQIKQLRPKARNGTVVAPVQRKVEIEVHLEAINVSAEQASIEFDKRYVRLVRGEAEVKLPAGTFERDVSWTLEAVEEVEQTWVGVTAGLQSVGFNLKIPRLKRVV